MILIICCNSPCVMCVGVLYMSCVAVFCRFSAGEHRLRTVVGELQHGNPLRRRESGQHPQVRWMHALVVMYEYLFFLLATGRRIVDQMAPQEDWPRKRDMCVFFAATKEERKDCRERESSGDLHHQSEEEWPAADASLDFPLTRVASEIERRCCRVFQR